MESNQLPSPLGLILTPIFGWTAGGQVVQAAVFLGQMTSPRIRPGVQQKMGDMLSPWEEGCVSRAGQSLCEAVAVVRPGWQFG
jgi:hypothetical protein